MRPIITSPPPTGRVVGSPLPIAAGIGVLVSDLARVDAAMRSLLLPSEQMLAVARLRAMDTRRAFFVTIYEHRFSRVAIDQCAEPAVLQIPYADVQSSSWVPVTFWTAGESVKLGRLAFDEDALLLEAAMWNLTLPYAHEARVAAEGWRA